MDIYPVEKSRLRVRPWGIAGAVLALALAEPASADSTAFSGRGAVVSARLLGLSPIALSDTGSLPSSGGAMEAMLLEYPSSGLPDLLRGALHAEVLHATAVGQGQRSSTEASVASLSLALGGAQIAADFLTSRAQASCHAGAATVSGSSQVTSLSINGEAIAVSGQPNQTIALPNGSIVINEQQTFSSGNFGDITVNSLHIVIRGLLGGAPLADVVISSSHADILCAGPPPQASGDFVTGGGWITGTPSGQKGNFGVAGGIKHNGDLWGHLNYIDHGIDMHVKGTSVTAYITPDSDPTLGPGCRLIRGTAQIDSQFGFRYEVEVCDKGEPGSADYFSIGLSNGYGATGVLAGGNIQLHD